jgi:2-dehydropantoate 2-reductase
MAISRVCVIGAGTIGSLLAGHLGGVCEVSVLTRRPEHAAMLREHGLRDQRQARTARRAVRNRRSGGAAPLRHRHHRLQGARPRAERPRAWHGHAADGVMMTVQNGLGAEAVVARHGAWPIISAVTFMSGIRHSDVHVEYELDTATWMGPWAQTATPYALVEELAALMISAAWRPRRWRTCCRRSGRS